MSVHHVFQVPAVITKPRVKPATTTQQIVLNQQTFSQLTPQQQQQILAQYPRLQQLMPKTQVATSKRKYSFLTL